MDAGNKIKEHAAKHCGGKKVLREVCQAVN